MSTAVGAPGWEVARAGFLESRRAAGCTPKTTAYYADALALLERFGRERGMDGPAALSPADVRAFCVWLQDGKHGGRGPLRPASVRTHMRAAKAFLRFAHGEGWLPQAVPVPIPRVTEEAPPTLEPAEVEALLATARGGGFSARRDRAFLRLLLDTGCRLGEALALRPEDVDLATCTARVNGKKRQPRQVAFSRPTGQELLGYTEARRRLLQQKGWPDPGPIFLGDHGGPWPSRVAQRMLARRGVFAGVDRRKCHPHAFRHTFARAFLAGGGSGAVLQEVLGHHSYDMTRRYLRSFGAEAADLARPYLPGHALGSTSWHRVQTEAAGEGTRAPSRAGGARP